MRTACIICLKSTSGRTSTACMHVDHKENHCVLQQIVARQQEMIPCVCSLLECVVVCARPWLRVLAGAA